MINLNNLDIRKKYYYWDEEKQSVNSSRFFSVDYDYHTSNFVFVLHGIKRKFLQTELYTTSAECLAKNQKSACEIEYPIYLIDKLNRLVQDLEEELIIFRPDPDLR